MALKPHSAFLAVAILTAGSLVEIPLGMAQNESIESAPASAPPLTPPPDPGPPAAPSPGPSAGAPQTVPKEVRVAPASAAIPAPLRPAPEDVGAKEAPRRFDASLEALVRDRVVSPRERIRVHDGVVFPSGTANRDQACSSGALSEQECRTGVVMRGRGRPESEAYEGRPFAQAPSNMGNSERYGITAAPLPPISVPVNALLSSAGRSFHLTDVFRLTPRPGPMLGNGNVRLLYPLIGASETTSGFGWRLHPVLGTWIMHAGRDLAAPEGTPVVAALSGRVVSSGLAGGYGLAIELEHDQPRRQTLYGHLSEIYVKEGDRVRQGDVLGRVGSTGLSTGPHLHFELRVPQEGGWVAIDPGELDPGGSLATIASDSNLLGLKNQPVGLEGQPTDAVAFLMGQLIQSLERPRPSLSS